MTTSRFKQESLGKESFIYYLYNEKQFGLLDYF